MRTPKQIAASRANGARSKGPITAQGKRNSSRNSVRHGLLAETIVLEEEHTGRFLDLLKELTDEHLPATCTETMLVETIAVASWRRSRIWGMQKENFDHDVASCDVETDSPALCATLALRSSPESIRSHEVLLRYEIAFDRQISRSLLRLQQLQDRNARRKQESAARTSNFDEESSARRDSQKDADAERTQQPPEKKQPATAATANPDKPAPQNPSTRTPEAPQDVQCPAKLPVPSALQTGDVRSNRGRQ
jgi:hypothetical protein